jgi:hypothetical protein
MNSYKLYINGTMVLFRPKHGPQFTTPEIRDGLGNMDADVFIAGHLKLPDLLIFWDATKKVNYDNYNHEASRMCGLPVFGSVLVCPSNMYDYKSNITK